jgi:nucleoside 2-deoxyribosyltransferase
MPFDRTEHVCICTVCGSPANILRSSFRVGEIVNCSRCRDFEISHVVADNLGLPFNDQRKRALASHAIRKTQKAGAPRPKLSMAFFKGLENLSLPSPADLMDNLLLMLAEEAHERPGRVLGIRYDSEEVLGTIGAVAPADTEWVVKALVDEKLLAADLGPDGCRDVFLTPHGWTRVADLKRAHVSSRYAFFARQFKNDDLDLLFDDYLRQAVSETGYELHTVTQKAGHIDAIIEDEIRRCRFLIADLSDDNAGAYWEAGFAQGLGKDVIYICRSKDQNGDPMKTHFDTDHRQTVRWDLADPEGFVKRIKAVIRNTLLGDANQSD